MGMTLTALQALYDAAAGALTPEPVLRVDEWADAYRILGPTSPEPGPWRTDRAPYLREPMQAMSPTDPCEIVVLMWASQLAKTEVLLNALGHGIHISPSPMMVVQPDEDAARDFSRERIFDLISNCPQLSERVSMRRANATSKSVNTVTEKVFPGGLLTIVSSRSSTALASKPIRRVFLDEVDRYETDVKDEGDPVDLAIQRTVNWRGRKILMTSTPTVEGFSRIETAYLDTDRRRWWVPCPHCGTFQLLRWQTDAGYQFVWPKGAPEEAVYLCQHCRKPVQETSKAWMNANGVWRPERPEVTRIARGYHIPAMLSPWQRWSALARQWDSCHRDPVRLKTFVNLKLAETWKDHLGTALQVSILTARLEPYTIAPPGVVLVTGAVDTQDDRLEFSVWGWGAGEESWLLDHVVIRGDTQRPDVWAALSPYLMAQVQCFGGRTLPIAAVAVDTGGHSSQAAYQFCRDRERWSTPRVWAIKGSQDPAAIIWPIKPSKKNLKRQVNLYFVGVGQCKENFCSRLRMADHGPGFVHLPQAMASYGPTTEEFVQQFLAEVRRLKKIGGRMLVEWVKTKDGERNEALDCAVYAYAALHGLYRLGVRLPKEPPANLPAPPPPSPVAQPMAPHMVLDVTPEKPQATKQPPALAPKAPPRKAGGGWLNGGKLGGWLGGGKKK